MRAPHSSLFILFVCYSLVEIVNCNNNINVYADKQCTSISANISFRHHLETRHAKRDSSDCCIHCNYDCYENDPIYCCGYDYSAQKCRGCFNDLARYCCSDPDDYTYLSGQCCEKPCGCLDCSTGASGSAICEEDTGDKSGKQCCRTSCCNGKCCPDRKTCVGGECCDINRACNGQCCGSMESCQKDSSGTQKCMPLYVPAETYLFAGSLLFPLFIFAIIAGLGTRKGLKELKEKEYEPVQGGEGEFTMVGEDGRPLPMTTRQKFYIMSYNIVSYPFYNMFLLVMWRWSLVLPVGVFTILELLASNVCCREKHVFTSGQSEDCSSIGPYQRVIMAVFPLFYLWYFVGAMWLVFSGATISFFASSSNTVGNVTTTTTSVTTSNNLFFNFGLQLFYVSMFVGGCFIMTYPQWFFGTDIISC